MFNSKTPFHIINLSDWKNPDSSVLKIKHLKISVLDTQKYQWLQSIVHSDWERMNHLEDNYMYINRICISWLVKAIFGPPKSYLVKMVNPRMYITSMSSSLPIFCCLSFTEWCRHRVEVCSLTPMDELLWRWRYPACTIQCDA